MLRFLSVLLLACLSFATFSFAASKADVETQFRQWLRNDFWPEAKKAGISNAAFEAAFKGVRLDWDLPDLAPPGFPKPKQRKQSQAEFSSPGSYFSEKRLQGLAATGRSLASAHASTLKRIERTYGVPVRSSLPYGARNPASVGRRSRIRSWMCWRPRLSCRPGRSFSGAN